jgi:hypothetical protein
MPTTPSGIQPVTLNQLRYRDCVDSIGEEIQVFRVVKPFRLINIYRRFEEVNGYISAKQSSKSLVGLLKSPQAQQAITNQHGVISQKTRIVINTAVSNFNLAQFDTCYRKLFKTVLPIQLF